MLGVMWRIVNASTRLTCITAGYGWFTIIRRADPGRCAQLFQRKYSFGTLMMVVGAFMQVQGAPRWFIDNFCARLPIGGTPCCGSRHSVKRF